MARLQIEILSFWGRGIRFFEGTGPKKGNNEIQKFTHDGPLGNPCIDSADTWIFEAPINHGDKTKIMLGANGCDTAINYIIYL